MAKLKTPLLSLDARGGLGKVLSFVRRRKQNIVEKKPVPEDAKTLAQLSWRHMYLKAVALWNALSASDKLDWESLARPHHMTGYAYFLSQALKPNPGLYLPLQGGTMSGNIDMAKNKLEKLPTPTDSQEADTKGARDTAITTHAGQPIIHQNAPALIATHAAIANVHHTPPPNTFLGETDTPGSYAGQALKVARVNAAQNALEFATPTVGATLTIAQTQVFNGNAPTSWTNLDLSGTVGSQKTLVLLKVETNYTSKFVAFRQNGDTDDSFVTNGVAAGCSFFQTYNTFRYVLTYTDASGIIEWKCNFAVSATIDVVAYIK